MSPELLSYFIFGFLLILALTFDLGLLSKKNKVITLKQALYQTFFWVGLALSFMIYMWIERGQTIALEYLSAYLMEWSLSIDNIFVFVLIFSSFRVKEQHIPRVLLIGILMAILFRIIFITVGVVLVAKFHWILYIFGVFLLYTGIKMFNTTEEEEFDPHHSKAFKIIRRFMPLVNHDGGGKFVVRENGKRFYTTLSAVVLMLAIIDIVFALDSIPAVMGISLDRYVIYTSNIFAVLGLRSLYFALSGIEKYFHYLKVGLSAILLFVGVKMCIADWYKIPVDISLIVIVSILAIAVVASLLFPKKEIPAQEKINEEA